MVVLFDIRSQYRQIVYHGMLIPERLHSVRMQDCVRFTVEHDQIARKNAHRSLFFLRRLWIVMRCHKQGEGKKQTEERNGEQNGCLGFHGDSFMGGFCAGRLRLDTIGQERSLDVPSESFLDGLRFPCSPVPVPV